MRFSTTHAVGSALGFLLLCSAAYAQEGPRGARAPRMFGEPVAASPAEAATRPGPQQPFGQAARPLSPSAIVERPLQEVNYGWSGSAWENPTRITYTYNTAAQPTEILSSDSLTGQLRSKMLQTYNAQGKLTETLYQNWDGTTWQNDKRYQYTYNAQGARIQSLRFGWQNGAWAIISGSQYDNTYDVGGLLITSVWKVYQNGTFENSTRRTYSYSAGKINSVLVEKWDNGAWANQDRFVDYTWNGPNGWWTGYRWQAWNGTAFVDSSRTTSTYTGVGYSYVDLTQKPSGPTSWVDYERITYQEDAFGNYLSFLSEQRIGGAWVIQWGDRDLLGYTPTNAVARRVSQTYSSSSGQYDNGSRSNYSNFQAFTVFGLPEDRLSAATQLYPNPTTDRVTLALPEEVKPEALTGEVRNALGQVVLTFTARPEGGAPVAHLDVRGLAAGLYSVRVATPDGVVVKPLVRQ